MYSKFLKLKPEKRENILAACIREFSERGYEQASTNVIVKEAGISKGILFHYFQNKKGLFLYLFDYCFQKVLAEFRKYPLTETGDIFQRLTELGMFKLRLYQANPQYMHILLEALINAPPDLRTEVETKYSQVSKDLLPSFFRKIDTSKFRQDIDSEKAIQLLMLVNEALGQKYLDYYKGQESAMLADMDKVLGEYSEFMEMLKYGMYAS